MRAVVGAAAAVAVLALVGCAASPLVAHRRGGVAADRAALLQAWSTPATQPGWLPADATRIRWVAATRGGADRAPAAIEARSDARLPAACTPAGSVAGVAITASWSPDRAPVDVRRCGNWAVAAVPGGWYGWTPADRGTSG